MKLVSFSSSDGRVRPGSLIEEGNLVADLSGAGYKDTIDVISAGSGASGRAGTYPAYPITDVRLHAPISNPPRVFAIGLNYRDHAKESGMAIPTTPVVFFKLTTAIIGPGDAIMLPRNSTEPDYEAELAFVIGKGGYRIPASAWREHVYGYTIVNDVSARDVQFATSQWSMSKSFPTFCPVGPAIVSADEIGDPHRLAIGLSIDGEVLQNSNTSELVFKIPELVEYLSSITPLLPGDIVSTGTPPGVGLGRTPKRWLKPGETVTVTVEGLGALTNPVIAE
ncbi:MAG TPA: fumarylacetoacetate hydrolase family protein [Terracidiphilus sp.]|jgi:2-keto-4-pentenoate hydratase/2-oxohepta-3-ene-1,7-dioic acid hydratase in catechol pathway|nr:fumarylacetoacetate hydrolase family protein [Terracidiphilus sp.]